MKMHRPSVAIVGAGVAGIAAASRLMENGIHDITILEAENRIGGRIFTTNLDESNIELGAQWIHGEELNVVYGLGKPSGLIENSLNDFSKVTCVLSNGNFIDGKVSSLLYQVCQDILHEDTIKKIDGSVGEYISKRFKEKIITDIDNDITHSYLEWFHSFKNSIDGSDSWFELSSHNDDYVECSGNLLLRWKHGYKTIFDLLMKKYSDDPSQELPLLSKTLLNKEVTTIEWKNVKPKVVCRDGTSYSADHVIVTVSLGVLKECAKTLFEPPLPGYKLRAIDGLEIGTVNKIFLKFPFKWWPEDCHGFSFLWKQQDRDNCELKDNNAWARDIFGFYADDSGPTVLLGWVVGPSARQMETFSDRDVENACMVVLNKFLGKMYNIPQPLCIARSKWHSNPHFRGSYSYHSIRTENSNASPEHLTEPLVVDNRPVVMFAGEATHNHFFSTVHGGLETGWREANRIISSYKYKKCSL